MSPWVGPLLFIAGFGAGFVDSIAGGGGMITVPVLFGIGLPPAEALATNKLQSTFGSASAVWTYRRAGLVSWTQAWPGILATASGAALGVWAVTALDAGTLKRVVPFLLLAAAATLWKRPTLGDESRPPRLRQIPFLLGFGIVLGFYDGFFGPGTGTFWTIAFVLLLGFELLRATAWTKWMNFTSNAVALVAFLSAGKVHWAAGLWMGAGQAIGARCGARMAMRSGARLIRPLLLTMASLAAVKLLWDAWGSVR